MQTDRIQKQIEKNPYIEYLGIEFLEVSEEYARAKLMLREDLKNPMGTLHGGVLYSLADIVAGTAATMRGNYVTTVSGEFSYLSPGIHTEYVIAEAKMIRFGAHLAVYRIDILDDKGNTLDIATFTYFDVGVKVSE